MYKVLVVDDERIIRDGIASIIEWDQQGFLFVGAASNGVEAYEMILRDTPQIVITDIKMPGINGLELISKVKEEFPEMIFVILSGYGEFDLAKEAMRYGVKYYLLKPCNENKIIEVLIEIRSELIQREDKEEFTQKNRENFEKVLPLVREQFLRDFVTKRNYAGGDFEYYCRLLNIEDKSLQLVVFQPEGEFGFEELFGLMKIIEDVFAEKKFFNSTIKNQVLIMIQAIAYEELIDMIHEVKKAFSYYHTLEVTVVYSDIDNFKNAPLLYKEVQECLKYSFYLGEGSIITKKDIELGRDKSGDEDLIFDYEAIAVAIKSGNVDAVGAEIDNYFHELQLKKCGINIIKTYAVQLFMVVIRQCPGEVIDKYTNKIIELQNLKSFEQIQEFVKAVGDQLAEANHENIITIHSKLVRTVVQYLQEHLENEDLSLKWLSNHVLYLSDGYISKLFIKETGEKFSHYLMRVRMEKAKELIEKSDDDRICEVAQKVGFGNNPQYFSQLFKKYTGWSPSEYKKGV
jgi:two-component system, response regulator YesN